MDSGRRSATDDLLPDESFRLVLRPFLDVEGTEDIDIYDPTSATPSIRAGTSRSPVISDSQQKE